MDRWENRKADEVTGGYGVLEPNGMVRSVNYYVIGSSGYQTVVQTRTAFGRKDQLIFLKHDFEQPRTPFQFQKPVALIQL